MWLRPAGLPGRARLFWRRRLARKRTVLNASVRSSRKKPATLASAAAEKLLSDFPAAAAAAARRASMIALPAPRASRLFYKL